MPDKALMTVCLVGGPPTLERAAHELGVPIEAIDGTYGLVLLDPKQGLYGVQVDPEHLPSHPAAENFHGLFSNPPIEPIGPPQGERDSGRNSH